MLLVANNQQLFFKVEDGIQLNAEYLKQNGCLVDTNTDSFNTQMREKFGYDLYSFDFNQDPDEDITYYACLPVFKYGDHIEVGDDPYVLSGEFIESAIRNDVIKQDESITLEDFLINISL